MTKRVAIFAGEASGDLQGAALARALLDICEDIVIDGFGGPRMAKEGVHLLADSCLLGIIGPWQVLGTIHKLASIYAMAKKYIRERKPALLILIDAPALNMRLAAYARIQGVKTAYYFPPSAWTTNVERAREIASRVDRVLPAFAFTAELYEKAGRKAFYFGHPLKDIITVPTREEILRSLKLPEGKRFIGILPGSRLQEVNALLPVLLESAEILTRHIPDCHFLIPTADDKLMKTIQSAASLTSIPVSIFQGNAWEIMAISDILLMASGSASLEAALIGTPMILVYKLPWPDWILGKLIRLRITFFGLPNLIAGRAIIPEFLQTQACPENVTRHALEILTQENVRQKMKEELARVAEQLGEQGVIKRVAENLKEFLND